MPGARVAGPASVARLPTKGAEPTDVPSIENVTLPVRTVSGEGERTAVVLKP